jgi:DNA processing protein
MSALSDPPGTPGTLEVVAVAVNLDLLTLSLLRGVGTRAVHDLLARAPVEAVLGEPRAHADLLSADALARLLSGEARRAAEAEQERAQRLGVRILSSDEPDYPAALRPLYAPPIILYVRGVLREDRDAVAIVGSRAASVAGRVLARSLARDLAGGSLTVVSGLARGIDTVAHEGALDAHGRTVAVLGSGLDRVYPPENAALARRIAEGGAVVSEFALGTPPDRGHFPRRNRVIAGWSRAVVVVEAAAKSGALSTARAALDEGREVMAVPGHPSDPGAAGVNALIRDGAVLVRDAHDVAAELGLVLLTEGVPSGGDPLLRLLPRGAALGLDALRERSGLETPALLARLTELELRNEVRRLPGAMYARHP